MAFQRRMRALPLSQIRMTDAFWTRWQKVLVETTLPAEHGQLVSTGRLANFGRAAAGARDGYEGFLFNDSDVYKWAEACAYALVHRPSAELQTMLDGAIAKIQAAQLPDGYLNTFFQIRFPELRWRNLNMMHEMYCGGHLIEAGVALFQCLGDRRLLDVAIRFADHVMSVFGPDQRPGYCGHEEIEWALVRLAEATGEPKYREFSRWLVESRGHRPSPLEAELDDAEALALAPEGMNFLRPKGVYVGDYCQDHAPIREHTEVVGHAVRAMYLYMAAADLADGANDERLERALQSCWDNLTKRRMYVTGGIGPSASNEGFTTDYDLPNLSAYAETCAACGLVFWGRRMLEMTGDSTYADTMERALYNGALAGVSLAGDRFFYANPLESRGTHVRTPWFSCACCPPNIARLIGDVSSYVAGAGDEAFYLHIPAGIVAHATLGGVPTTIEVVSDYPWSGTVKVKIDPERPAEFALHVRIPDWADDVSAELPDADQEAEYETGYMVFRRTWKPGEVLSLDFEMAPKWIEADPRVRENLGRACLTSGPLVYAAERHDLGFAPQLLTVDAEGEVEVERSPILEGVNVLTADATMDVELFSGDLYAEVGNIDVKEARPRFIPYYAWNNRGATDMQVWIRRM